MAYKEQYLKRLPRMLADESICPANRDLFRRFFEFEEYKLKRSNNLRQLDEACYKTLYGYTIMLLNVNRWFGNKPWKDLTRDDIKRVYDDLEDCRILNGHGNPYRCLRSYYNKILKSKPFRLAGKAELSREVIEFPPDATRTVRFVEEEHFRRLVSVVANPVHLLLFWLAWDVGESVGALLQLSKRDFSRQANPHTNEPEYLVNLPQGKLKRSRLSRSEPTLYPETVRYADIVLDNLRDDERVFQFGHRQALKVIHSAVRRSGAKCRPDGSPIRWKDLRSGMACHLLKSGWSREEVDARLGHAPNSSALNAYINFLAIDRSKPKERMTATTVSKLRQQLEHERLAVARFNAKATENEDLRAALAQTREEIASLRETVAMLLKREMTHHDTTAIIGAHQSKP